MGKMVDSESGSMNYDDEDDGPVHHRNRFIMPPDHRGTRRKSYLPHNDGNQSFS